MAQGGSGGIRQQISLVGDQEIKNAFDRLGASGEKAFETINKAARKAAGGLETVGTAANVSAAGFVRLRSGINGLTAGFTTVLRAADSLKGALGGLLAFESVRKSIDIFKEGLESLREVRNTAAGTGVATDTVKAFQVAMAQAGLAGERAGPALVQFMGTVSDAQKDVKRLGNSLFSTIDVMKGTEGSARSAASGINTMRGDVSSLVTAGKDLTKVFRGGTEAPLVNLGEAANEQAKSFARLGIDVSKYGKTQAEVDRLLEDTAKQFAKLRETVPADVIRSMSLAFGEDDIVKFSKTLEIIAEKGLPELKREAADLGIGPSADDNKRLQDYDTAVGNLNLRLLALKQQVAIAFAPFVGLEARGAENFIKGLTIEIGRIRDGLGSLGRGANDAFGELQGKVSEFFQGENISKLFDTFWAQFVPAGSGALDSFLPIITDWFNNLSPLFTDPWTVFSNAASAAFDSIRNTANSVLSAIGDKISSLASSLGSLFSGAIAGGGTSDAFPGFAGGGMVSGPGTGTSDSVPAWLSNGEFVMRQRAVDFWGPRFMASLNSLRNPFKGFSMGGLVDGLSAPLVPRSAPRFAAGGMVAAASAGSGTTVVLNLDGVPHRMQTDEATGESLLRLARKARMLRV